MVWQAHFASRLAPLTVSGSQSAMQISASQGLQRVVVMGSPTKQLAGTGAAVGEGVGVEFGVMIV